MKITTKGRYGLRAMVALAESYGTGPISLSTMARRQGQSRKYLHILLTLLKNDGLVATLPGKNGGYILTRSPAKITMKHMLTALEGKIADLDCFDDIKKVKNPKKCKVRKIWGKITSQIEKLLDQISLLDMATGHCRFTSFSPAKKK